MKTKLEIIEETAAHYNSNNRAIAQIDGRECCVYLDENGDMCAVGRCMIEPELNNREHISIICPEYHKIDPLLKPEYRGHDYEFWCHLQYLHDYKEHWNENGLSEEGIKYKNALIEEWAK